MVLAEVCEQMKESHRRVIMNETGTGRKCANVISCLVETFPTNQKTVKK